MVNQLEKKYGWILWLALIIIAFIAGYYSFKFRNPNSNQTEEKSSESISLAATEIKPQDTLFTQKYIGYVQPIHEANVQPFISGFIEKVLVKGGQYVKKGDILLVLQQDQYKAQLDAAYADIVKAQANLDNAQMYYNRLKKAGNKAVSPTDLDNAKAQFLSAQADAQQASANYAAAKVNFDYTILRSPIDGIVGEVFLTPGNYVSPASEPLFSIIQYSPLRVVFSITDKEYFNLLAKPQPFKQDTISLQLPNGNIFPNPGTFKYADNSVNKSTNSVAVYADFENIGKTLVPNAYVSVLVKQTFKNTVLISKDLLSMESDGNYVFIIRNGRLIKEKVNIVASENTDFIVENSFNKGDYLLTQKPQPDFFNKLITPLLLSSAEKR